MANVDFAFILVKSRYLDRFLRASSMRLVLSGHLTDSACVDRVKIPVKFLYLLTLKSQGNREIGRVLPVLTWTVKF
jgi:hypothetical protein